MSESTTPDPTLASRPVPLTRSFPVQSFGPGADVDIRTAARSLREIDAEINPEMYAQAGISEYDAEHDEVRQLLQEVETWENVAQADNDVDDDEDDAGEEEEEPPGRNPDADPTWGYYLFVTDYSARTEEYFSAAVENLIKVVQRRLTQFTVPPFTEETFRRFKLDVIQDKEALDGASDDRIREEFRAQIRGQGLVDREGDINFTPARNMVCLVLNANTVEMLSSLTMPEDAEQDYEALRENTIRVVDICFDNADSGDISDYRGVGDCPINSLPRLYMLITSDGNSGAMEDLHPINSGSSEL